MPPFRRAVEKKFNLCGYNPLDDENNIALLADDFGEVVTTIPQNNDPGCEHTRCNIKLFCGNLSIMTKSTVSAIDALQLMHDFQIQEKEARGYPAPACWNVNYAEFVDFMNSS